MGGWQGIVAVQAVSGNLLQAEVELDQGYNVSPRLTCSQNASRDLRHLYRRVHIQETAVCVRNDVMVRGNFWNEVKGVAPPRPFHAARPAA